MDPGEIQLVEQTRQVNTAFGQYQWAQARPASIKGCVPVYPPKSLYPQLDKNMSQIAREPQNLDGMERPFLDANEQCKPGLSLLKNYVYPTTTPYPPTVKPNIEMPFNALDDPHQGWKRYLAETENKPLAAAPRTQVTPTTPVTPSAPSPCATMTAKDFPSCLVSAWKDTFYNVTHWNQVPNPKFSNTFVTNHRLIYLLITLAVAILVIVLLTSLFRSRPSSTTQQLQQQLQQEQSLNAYLESVIKK